MATDKPTSLGDAIRDGSKWLFTNNVAYYALSFIANVILARLLAPEDFGLLVTINIFTGIAGYISGGGMTQALIQIKDLDEQYFNVVFTLQLLVGAVIYLIFFIASPWFAAFFNDPIYQPLVQVAALTFLIRPFHNIPVAKLQRAMKFRPMVIANFVNFLIGTGLSIWLAVLGFKVWSLVLAGLAGTFIYVAVLFWITRWQPRFSLRKDIIKRVAGYGAKVSANEILDHFRVQVSNFVISRMQGPAMAGLYNKADSLNTLPAEVMSKSLYQSVLRALSIVQDNKDQSSYIYYRSITLLLVYTAPLYVGLWWVAEPFIHFVYGEKWLPAAAPLKVLVLAGLFLCLHQVALAVLAAQNRLGRTLVIQAGATVIAGAGAVIGIRWGLTGVAWGMVCSTLFLSLGTGWLAMRSVHAKASDFVVAISPSLLLSLCLATCLWLVHHGLPSALMQEQPHYYLGAMILSGAVVYGGGFLFLPIPALAKESGRWKKLIGFKNISS